MVADGRAPWCLGLEAGSDSGASAASFVEEIVLHATGPTVYDSWAAGTMPFAAPVVRGAFSRFGGLAFPDGAVLGGRRSALLTPQAVAAWPMFTDPPECWLGLGGGTDRLSWPAGRSATLAAFPFPPIDPSVPDSVRGRVFTIVVFRDRPEVRWLVDELLGGIAADAAGSLVQEGIWPLALAGAAAPPADGAIPSANGVSTEGDLLARALRAGTFRVSALDLVPSAVRSAFAGGMMTYLTWGESSLSTIVNGIDASWPKPTGAPSGAP
jgi:alpha-glucoside transport system substrate-binding protein